MKYSDGQVVSVIEGVTDITERKEEEKKIQRERIFLEKLLETSPEAITVVNRDGQLTLANAMAEKTHGMVSAIEDVTERKQAEKKID